MLFVVDGDLGRQLELIFAGRPTGQPNGNLKAVATLEVRGTPSAPVAAITAVEIVFIGDLDQIYRYDAGGKAVPGQDLKTFVFDGVRSFEGTMTAAAWQDRMGHDEATKIRRRMEGNLSDYLARQRLQNLNRDFHRQAAPFIRAMNDQLNQQVESMRRSVLGR